MGLEGLNSKGLQTPRSKIVGMYRPQRRPSVHDFARDALPSSRLPLPAGPTVLRSASKASLSSASVAVRASKPLTDRWASGGTAAAQPHLSAHLTLTVPHAVSSARLDATSRRRSCSSECSARGCDLLTLNIRHT
eukprot:scaffold25626_cov60-Phaeocystis_antarctica.AAC.2